MDDTRLQQVSQPVLRDAGIKVKLLENVSQNTIDAARTGSVRQVLVSLLSERPMGCSYHGLKAYMTRLAKAVPQFSIPSSKGDLERILKSIADYKPPGVYRLKDTLHTASMPQMDPKNSHTSANTVEENCRDNERTQNAGQGGPPSVPFSKDFRDERNGSVSRAYPLSSSSRGSEDTEEGWILHHINREPERLPTIVTREVTRQCLIVAAFLSWVTR